MTGTVETPIPAVIPGLDVSAVLPAHEPVIPAQAQIVWERWAHRSPTQVAGGLQAMLRVLAAQGGWAGDWRLVPLGAESMTAATRFDTKQVAVTFAPLLDDRLSPDQRGAVMLSGLLHEVGHVVGTAEYDRAVRDYVTRPSAGAMRNVKRMRPGRNRGAWLMRAMAYTNLLEDVRTERETARVFPVFGDVLPMIRWWIVSKRPVGEIAQPEYRDEVFGFAVAVTRYRQWATQPKGVRLDREVSWWVEWADRWAQVGPWDRIEGLWEAIDHENKRPQRKVEQTPPPPPPPPPGDDEPEPTDEDWDQGGGQTMPDDESDDETAGDETDEPDDEDGDGDEDEQDEDPDGDESGDEPDDDAGTVQDEPDEDDPDADPDPDEGDEDDEDPGDEADDDDEDDDEDDDGPGSGLRGDDVSNDGDGDEDGESDEDGDEDGDDEDEDPDLPVAPTGPPPPMPLHAQDVLTNPEQDAAAMLGQAVVVSQSLGDNVVTVWADGTDRTAPDRTYWMAEPGKGPLSIPGTYASPGPRWLPNQQGLPPDQVLHRSVVAKQGEWVDNHTLSIRVRAQVLDVKRLPRVDRYAYGLDTDRVVADPAAARALREAFRVGRSRWTAPVLGHSGVRLDSRRVHRLGGDDSRVFIRGGARSPDLLDVHLIVDRSRSMATPGAGGTSRLQRAHGLIQSLALALRQESHVRLTVWSESDGQAVGGEAGGLVTAAMQAAGREDPHSWVYRHWTTSDGITTLHSRLQWLQAWGGFHDATAIQTVVSQIEVQPKTRTVVMVLSDGEPMESMGFVAKAVLAARRKGIEVFGIGMADGLTASHVLMYGASRVIPFSGDWNALGRRLAQVLGRLLA
jgi:hypothetical protein